MCCEMLYGVSCKALQARAREDMSLWSRGMIATCRTGGVLRNGTAKV